MLRRLFALAILLGLVAGGLYYWKRRAGASAPELGAVGRRIDDAKVHASVKTAFELNRRLHALDLRLEAEDGVVTLRGDVPDAETLALAEQVAGAVPGVRQVVSHLRVSGAAAPPASDAGGRTLGESLDDRAIEVKVRLALSLHRELEGARVDVRAFRREVTLSGELTSEAQRGAALATVRDIPDVARVVDRLRVAAGGDEAGGRASGRRAAVERALALNDNLGRYAIRVRAQDGQLVLVGRVATGAEKELAGLLARQAAGGPVRNALEVGFEGSRN